MSFMIKSGDSADIAKVDPLGQVHTRLAGATDLAGIDGAGFVALAGVLHNGNQQPLGITNNVARRLRPIGVSRENRLRTGIPTALRSEQFQHTQFPVSQWYGVTSTMTISVAGGFLTLNAGGATANGNVARAQTIQTFSPQEGAPVEFDIGWQLSAVPQANSVIEFGPSLSSGVAPPSDGVGFRINGAGSFAAFISYNGSESSSIPLTGAVIPANSLISCKVIWGVDAVEFYINDVLVGEYSAFGGAGSGVTISNSLPFTIRQYNNGIAGGAVSFKLASFKVNQRDEQLNIPVSLIAALQGLGGQNLPPGQAAGQMANYANSAAPSAATLSNTAAGYATNGGQFLFNAVAGAETDYALFAWLNPAATASNPGKPFVHTGTLIDTINTGAAVATTETLLQWSHGYGGTGVSLATVDSATAGTRKARIEFLGYQAFVIGAAIGAQARVISENWGVDAGRIVEPGTYLHTIVKMPRGTATASQAIRGGVAIRGFFMP
jgi:hypothetical protein